MAKTNPKSKIPDGKVKEKLQTYFDACEQAFEFSGVAMVARNGKRLWTGTAGHANREHRVLNSEKTKFRLASITKSFTAIAIMQLQEKRKLKISEPVSRYFKKAPKHWKNVTVHHLLTHTSGIPSYTDFPEANQRKSWTPIEIVDIVKDKPLAFKPGDKFDYCNTGYVLLGILIETLSGKTYAQYLKENIFEPLGMKDSGVDENSPVMQHRAQGYKRNHDNQMENSDYLDMTLPYSAGSLYSTADDLGRLDRALSNGNLLSKASMKAMLTPALDNYALGWDVQEIDGREVCAHAGGINGFTTNFERVPEEGYCSIILSNIEGAPVNYMADGLRAIVLGAPYEIPKKFKAAKVDASKFKDFEGDYELGPGFIITVSRKGDCLMAQATEQDKLVLIPSSSHQFFFVQIYASITFHRDKSGKVTHLVLHQNNKDQQAKRIAKPAKSSSRKRKKS